MPLISLGILIFLPLGIPEKTERSVGMTRESPPLLRFFIGKENKTSGIKTFQKNPSNLGVARLVYGGERHPIGKLKEKTPLGKMEPARKFLYRILVQVALDEWAREPKPRTEEKEEVVAHVQMTRVEV